MKTVIVNAGPRKNWSCAKLLEQAKAGAEEAGREVDYVELFNLVFTGCRSCMVCKRKGLEDPCKCYWKDMLSPVIDSIYKSDTLLIASPVYFGQPTGAFRSLLERVLFPALTYNDFSSIFKGSVDVGIFLTMNVREEGYESRYREKFETEFQSFGLLNGRLGIYPSCDTLQVSDYSKYEMSAFDEEHKRKVREEIFEKELKRAFEIGKNGIVSNL